MLTLIRTYFKDSGNASSPITRKSKEMETPPHVAQDTPKLPSDPSSQTRRYWGCPWNHSQHSTGHRPRMCEPCSMDPLEDTKSPPSDVPPHSSPAHPGHVSIHRATQAHCRGQWDDLKCEKWPKIGLDSRPAACLAFGGLVQPSKPHSPKSPARSDPKPNRQLKRLKHEPHR